MADAQWMLIETAPRDGTFVYLARGERVTFGQLNMSDTTKNPGWLSWDGGFSKTKPPTYWSPAEYQDWGRMSAQTKMSGFPAPPDPEISK